MPRGAGDGCLWAAHKGWGSTRKAADHGHGGLISFNPAIPLVGLCPKEVVGGVEKIYVQQALFKIAENWKNT